MKPEAIEAAAKEWWDLTEPLKESGLQAAYLMYDKAQGKFFSLTVWESKAAQEQNAKNATNVQERNRWSRHLIEGPVAQELEVLSSVE